jgi:membrane protease subunit HflK
MFRLLNNIPQSPWSMPGSDKKANSENNSQNKNGGAGNNGNSSQNNKNKKPNDFLKKIDEFLKKIFARNNLASNSPKSIIGLVVLALILLWLTMGIYKVDTDENAAVLYFGKFYKITTPGLNYYIPYPFGQVIKKSVTSVNTEEFGFSSNSKKTKRDFDAESLMLTGDENIVDIEFQVQWQIADIKDFTFNIAEPNQSIRKAAESAMREIIARTPIVEALSDGKSKIELDTRELLQQILDSYKAGVRIVVVQLRRVDPPLQVIDAFRDVQTAKADKEKEINQAQAYANDIIPRARGAAAQQVEEAAAYQKEVVTNAEGESGRFMSVWNQYVKSKQVTKKRIYLETMEKIYRNNDKIFIDKSAAKSGVMPIYPLDQISKAKTN